MTVTAQPHSSPPAAAPAAAPAHLSPVDGGALVPSPAAPPASPPLAPRLPGWRGTFAWGLVRAVRPRQWVKNVLVLAAPLAAGRIFEADVLIPTAVAFV